MAKGKDKNKGKIKLAVRYAVSVPEKDLMNIVKCDAASKLLSLCSTVKGIKKSGRVPQGFFDDLNRLTDALTSIAAIVSEVQGTWGEDLKKYVDEGRLPSDDLNKYSPPQKTEKNPGLSKEEKAKVERLRKKGFPIKDIGKLIHRAEKVVSEYAHLLDKKKKK